MTIPVVSLSELITKTDIINVATIQNKLLTADIVSHKDKVEDSKAFAAFCSLMTEYGSNLAVVRYQYILKHGGESLAKKDSFDVKRATGNYGYSLFVLMFPEDIDAWKNRDWASTLLTAQDAVYHIAAELNELYVKFGAMDTGIVSVLARAAIDFVNRTFDENVVTGFVPEMVSFNIDIYKWTRDLNITKRINFIAYISQMPRIGNLEYALLLSTVKEPVLSRKYSKGDLIKIGGTLLVATKQTIGDADLPAWHYMRKST